MKCFYRTSYRFYKPNQKEHKILAISDIHFSDFTQRNIDELAAKIESQKPDLITISGDLIDSLESVDETHEIARLKAWLSRIGKTAPVCMCLGNHDFYRKPDDYRSGPSRKRHYIAERNDNYLKLIRSVDNVHLLDTSSYENDDFYVFGLTLPPSYYQFDYITEKHGNVLHPGNEDLNILLEELDDAEEFLTKLPKRKTKIALIHSPVHLNNPAVKEKLQNFDFVLAGHMHNGVVPPVMNEIWRSRRGIVTPSKHLLKNHNTRAGLYDKLIVLGAVTTIQKGAGPFSFLNHAFPLNYATIETTHNELYARKPDVHKKYEKWQQND